MILRHGDYLTIEVPDEWTAYEEDDIVTVYQSEEGGALTMSFYRFNNGKENTLDNLIHMANRYIDDNDFDVLLPVSAFEDPDTQRFAVITDGILDDKEFLRCWYIASYPHVVWATYNCQKQKNLVIKNEISVCNSIISKLKFESPKKQ